MSMCIVVVSHFSIKTLIILLNEHNIKLNGMSNVDSIDSDIIEYMSQDDIDNLAEQKYELEISEVEKGVHSFSILTIEIQSFINKILEGFP